MPEKLAKLGILSDCSDGKGMLGQNFVQGRLRVELSVGLLSEAIDVHDETSECAGGR